MFEDGFDEEWYAAAAAGDTLLDASGELAAGADPLWQSLSAEELDWLREHPLPPSVEQVLHAAQHEPVTAELVGRLDAIDPASLDDAGRLAYANGVQRVANAMLARKAEAVAGLTGAQINGNQIGNDRVDAQRLAASEVGAALALGSGAADLLVAVSNEFVHRLPRTLALARRGDLSWDKVTTLATATAPLSDEQVAAVEARVLPFAARRTPQQHRDAVRRAVDRIDPEGAERRRELAKSDVRMIATHYGDGMGELFARMPSEQLDVISAAADHRARAMKAAGDPRPLEHLRVAAMVGWAESYLSHGDPTVCDSAADGCTADAAPPTRHGRPASLRVLWDLSSLLGVTAHCGALSDSGATLLPEAMRELLARGARVRRVLIDSDADGELVDLTPCSWILPPRHATGSHLPPVQLQLVVDRRVREALLTGDFTGLDPASRNLAERIADLLPAAEPFLTDLLAYRITADDLDDDPDAEQPSATLAEFVAVRDRHPVNPMAGPTAAGAADIDHGVARSAGGKTVRDNLASLTRRWHVLKTHGGWTYRRAGRHWEWTSPSGLTYGTRPYDYRLGP